MLLPYGNGGPGSDHAARKVYPREESVDVVQPWCGIRLTEKHLQAAAEQRDGRKQEKANLLDTLTEENAVGVSFLHGY